MRNPNDITIFLQRNTYKANEDSSMSTRESVNRSTHFKKLGSFIGIITMLVSTHARALNIELTDVGSSPMPIDQLAAFEAAAQVWEDRLWDPITVDVAIAWAESDGVIAKTVAGKVNHSLLNVR